MPKEQPSVHTTCRLYWAGSPTCCATIRHAAAQQLAPIEATLAAMATTMGTMATTLLLAQAVTEWAAKVMRK